MTTSAVGLVVDEHDAGIAGLNVVIEDVSQQFDVLLDSQTTDTNGGFGLRYVGYKFEPGTPGRQIRKLRLRIRVGQHVVKEISPGRPADGRSHHVPEDQTDARGSRKLVGDASHYFAGTSGQHAQVTVGHPIAARIAALADVPMRLAPASIIAIASASVRMPPDALTPTFAPTVSRISRTS